MEKQTLPNSTLILVFGILSIIGCCCYGFLGIIFGVVALVMSKKAMELYQSSPELYTGEQNVKIGKILAIIGIILSALNLLWIIYIFATLGMEGYQEMIEEAVRQYQ